MTNFEIIITVLILSCATVLTRALPFLIFSRMKSPPKIISYLGRALPPAIFALLLVYCLKNVNFIASPHGIPEIIALIIVVVLHLWRRNMLLSIGVGTISYMLLVQLIF